MRRRSQPRSAGGIVSLVGAVAASWFAATGCNRSAPHALTAAAPVVAPTATPALAGHPGRCIVIATASVDQGEAPLAVALNAEGMCTHGAAAFVWDFGDASIPVEGASTTHVYAAPGTYVARVTITDTQAGGEDADEAPISVTAR
jgi:PKD repeat protein